MSTKACDAIPQEVFKPFIKLAAKRGQFWVDMFELCNALGLRNIEARELRSEQVDLERGIVTLNDSKQTRAYITKSANKAVDASWLIEGRKWLRANINDPMASLIVRLPTDTAQLSNLAQEYSLLDEFTEARESHYKSAIDEARAKASKSAPKGRTVDISRMVRVITILSKRIDLYGGLCGYLFPSCELKSNRATEFAPVSRQAVYRVISSIRESLEHMGRKVKEAITGVRFGLHSLRKSAVQRVASVMNDLLSASLWVGHGNGAGDIATTQRYLNKSARRMSEINDKLAAMHNGL
ncbi:hypothetical protein [Shewanella sp.]|uniref:hypothetical protein n=1 Tax=Shewanella sp. TaxID=50422 RepID=UPI003F33ECE9